MPPLSFYHASHFMLRDLQKAINADVRKKAEKANGSIPWLKDFAGQLEDPEYVLLTLEERGLLKDLRLLALRRGNKLPNDMSYLCSQLHISTRIKLRPKLGRLAKLRFLEVHPDAHELHTECAPRVHTVRTPRTHDAHDVRTEGDATPDNLAVLPDATLEPSESQVRLEKRGEEELQTPSTSNAAKDVADAVVVWPDVPGWSRPSDVLAELLERRNG